jgi:hypothetical protein
MIQMKIRIFFCGLLLAGGILLFSCAQDHIFYTIQYDKVLNKNATVPGSPGKIVRLGDALYVGSNAVYQYKPTDEGGNAHWSRLPVQPGGKKIMDLAGTEAASDNYLYALVMQGVELSDAGLYRKKTEPEDPWTRVDNPGFAMQSLFGAGNTLFVGARSGGRYVLLYVDESGESPTLKQVYDDSGMLKAAAFYSGKYYVALWDKGLLAANTPESLSGAVAVRNGDDVPMNFVGLIVVGDSLIAVSNSGQIWRIDGTGAVVDSKTTGASLNGALAIWDDPDIDDNGNPDLLLVGRAVSGGNSVTTYYYGYSELPITFSGETPVVLGDLQAPGLPGPGASTSASNNDSYYNTLGTHPVISLYQAPWDHVLFASTQQDGLWSCRQGDDPKEWNIE